MKPIFSNFFLTFFASSLLFLSGLQIVVVYGEDVELCSGESSFGNMQFLKHVWNHGSAASADSQWDESQGTIYQFKDSMNDIDGNPFNFETLKGKAVIITNVACDCGFTKSGYEHIVQWQKEFAGKPFEVVAFPSNAFNQEKKSAEEIKEHVKTTFGFEKILMEKSHINGEKTNPVYTWLKKSFPGDITWNFSSWMLVDHRGIPIQRFEKESWDEIKASLDAAVANAMKAEAEAEEEKKE